MKAGRAEVKTKRGVLRVDAEKWLEVADLILRSKRASRLAKWAIYCAGYAIEFVLKARICDVLGVDELPADYETHDLNKLAQSAGIHAALIREQKRNWQAITGTWSTALRYTGKQHNSREAEIFVARVKEVLRWLKKQPQS